MGLFGDLWDDAKQEVGGLIDDGAQEVGDVLNDVGLHGAANAVEVEGNKVGESLGGDVGELQLGQTSDPKELVHGNASTIRSTASQLTTFQSGFGEVAGGLKGIDTGHWEGAAADAFRAKFAPEPPKWSDACPTKEKFATSRHAAIIRLPHCRGDHRADIWTGLTMSGQSDRQELPVSHSNGMYSFREGETR